LFENPVETCVGIANAGGVLLMIYQRFVAVFPFLETGLEELSR